MNPIFEEISTATDNYEYFRRCSNQEARSFADVPTVVLHDGRKYEPIGESYGGSISFGKRFLHIAAITCMVAAGILLLFIPFFFSDYREALVDQLKKQSGINVHHIPLQPRIWQEWAVIDREIGVSERIRNRFERLPHDISLELRNNPHFLEAAACCVKIAFEGGEVKKQFIFKTQNLNSNELVKESRKIEQVLEKSLNEEINLESKYLNIDYALLFKEKNGRSTYKEKNGELIFKKAKGRIITCSRSIHRSAQNPTHKNDPILEEETAFKVKNFDKIDASVLEKMDFAGECVGPDGNFIEGKYFQAV